jgi:metallo-beta-lactamase class B
VSREDADVMAAGGRGDLALGPARFLWFLGALRFSPPRVDHTFVDGDTIRLGPIEVTAHVTAGHTRGCTSWSFPVVVPADTLLAVSICSLTLFPFVPLDSGTYPEVRADYERSFQTLRELPADIFLGSHTSWFNLHGKHRAQLGSEHPADPFIDPDGYRAFIDRAEQVYLDRVAGG